MIIDNNARIHLLLLMMLFNNVAYTLYVFNNVLLTDGSFSIQTHFVSTMEDIGGTQPHQT